MKVSEAIDSIAKRDIVLPEFQREYVWTREQAKQLIVSMVRGYPVGGILLWKTDQPPELKNIKKLPEKLGTVGLLLDGQQRLTTLHLLITGEIPAFYKAHEITSDPRDLYVNIASSLLNVEDFQYYQVSKMKDDPAWLRVADCFARPVSIFDIAKAKTNAMEDAFAFAEKLNKNLNDVTAIKNVDLPVQIVPPQASLDEAIDIFDRINSLGTKLTDAELALTHVTAKWPQARRELKQRIQIDREKGFDFSLTFMTRALVTAVTGRALFEVIHKRPAPEVISGWSRLTKVLDYLTGMLPTWAHIHSTEDLNTTNALIPIVAYLCQNGGTFPTQDSVKHAVNWLYAALMWSRYTSQTDQRLEGDVALVAKEMQPWDTLRAQIIDQRGRIKVEPSDFAGRGVQSPFYRATYVLAKAHNAVDWFNGLPLSKRHGKSFGIHSHHIFPQALLYKNGFNDSDYTDRQLVNEIANRAFLTADSNIANADAPLDAYLPEVDTKYPGALSSQFVPMDPNLWKVQRYRDFLVARRETIAMKLNEFMAALIEKPEIPHLRPVTELIKLGESYTLEFKSTLQWDIVQGKINKALRASCLKTIAAFLNSEGGTLVIGVEDDRSIYGLDADLKTLGDRDKFERLLVSMVSDGIGPSVSPYYKIRFEVVDGKDVCVVDVDRAAEHVFAKTEKGKEFFIRAGNTTKSLDPEEAHQYIEQHLV